MSGDPLVTVGNHGHRHAHMTWLTPAEQRADLALAAARFHTELGKAPDLFAYPYGEISQTLRRNVAEAGFTAAFRSEEHTSELQSLMRLSYAVFCLKHNNNHINYYTP